MNTQQVRSDVAYSLDSDSILKVRNFVKDINFAMFSTISKGTSGTFEELSIHSRPMCTQNVDFDGRTLWFFSHRHSPKCQEIACDSSMGIPQNWQNSGNNSVNVTYSDQRSGVFVSFVGKATVLERNEPIDKGFDNSHIIQSTTSSMNPPQFQYNDFYSYYLNDQNMAHGLRPWNNYWDSVFVRRGMLTQELIMKLWHRGLDSWFTGGITDPDICLIRVDVSGIEYWNSQTSKMVSLFSKIKGNMPLTSKPFEEKKILSQPPPMQQPGYPTQQPGYPTQQPFYQQRP